MSRVLFASCVLPTALLVACGDPAATYTPPQAGGDDPPTTPADQPGGDPAVNTGPAPQGSTSHMVDELRHSPMAVVGPGTVEIMRGTSLVGVLHVSGTGDELSAELLTFQAAELRQVSGADSTLGGIHEYPLGGAEEDLTLRPYRTCSGASCAPCADGATPCHDTSAAFHDGVWTDLVARTGLTSDALLDVAWDGLSGTVTRGVFDAERCAASALDETAMVHIDTLSRGGTVVGAVHFGTAADADNTRIIRTVSRAGASAADQLAQVPGIPFGGEPDLTSWCTGAAAWCADTDCTLTVATMALSPEWVTSRRPAQPAPEADAPDGESAPPGTDASEPPAPDAPEQPDAADPPDTPEQPDATGDAPEAADGTTP